MQHERMTEGRHDLLHMMGDEEQGRARLATELGDQREESLAGYGIQSGARFVQNQDIGLSHQRSRDQHALAFALGEDGPGTMGEVQTSHAVEKFARLTDIAGTRLIPHIDGGIPAANDHFDGGLLIMEQMAQCRTDQADAPSERRPIGAAEFLAQNLDGSARGRQIRGHGCQQ